jgi:hypothetical protein
MHNLRNLHSLLVHSNRWPHKRLLVFAAYMLLARKINIFGSCSRVPCLIVCGECPLARDSDRLADPLFDMGFLQPSQDAY